jgi:hypothetical protein
LPTGKVAGPQIDFSAAPAAGAEARITRRTVAMRPQKTLSRRMTVAEQ